MKKAFYVVSLLVVISIVALVNKEDAYFTETISINNYQDKSIDDVFIIIKDIRNGKFRKGDICRVEGIGKENEVLKIYLSYKPILK